MKSIAETLKVLQYMEKSYLGIPQTTATTAASAADDILVEKEEEMENLVQQKIINGKPPTDNTSAPKAQPKLKIVAPTKKISSKKILSSSATFKVNNADSTHTTNTSTTSPFSSYLDSTTSTTTPPPTISLEAFLSVSSLVRGRITLESVNKLLAILQQYFSNPKNMKHSSSLTLSQLAKLGVKPGKTTESQLKVLRQLGVVKIDSQGVVHRPLSANASSTRSSVRM